MESFNIEAEIAGKTETLVVVCDQSTGEKVYRLIRDGVDISALKQNGNLGWEVEGTPLNADELDSIGNQIKAKALGE